MRLYPVLEDLLSEWFARARPAFDGIRVAGNSLSPASFAVKDFLASNHVPYQWLDMDDDATVRELLSGASGGATRLPVVLFPDGATLVQPTIRELADKVGLQTRGRKPFYDLIIITKPVGQGTGLGLDIVRRLVDRNNGSIEVDTEPGRTEFRVALPVVG